MKTYTMLQVEKNNIIKMPILPKITHVSITIPFLIRQENFEVNLGEWKSQYNYHSLKKNGMRLSEEQRDGQLTE